MRIHSLLAVTALQLSLAVPTMAAEPQSVFARRTAVLAFSQRCDALTGYELLALQSGQQQARGSLLREGFTLANISTWQDVAQNSVSEIACDDQEAITELARVRESYQAWRNVNEMAYPGIERTWSARRDDSQNAPRWRVAQNLNDEGKPTIRFGTSSTKGKVTLNLVFEEPIPPRSILLRMRDPQKLAKPPSKSLRKLLQLPLAGLSGMVPPASATSTYFARSRISAEPTLLSIQEKNARGVRYEFSENALLRLSSLDPREAIIIEMIWSAGLGKPDRTRKVFAEVGDVLAARMFAEANDHLQDEQDQDS